MAQLLPIERDHRQIVKGDDYLAVDNRALVWESTSFPNLEGASIVLIVGYDNTNIYGQKATKLPEASPPAQPKEPTYKSKAVVELHGESWGKQLGESQYDYVLRATLFDKSIVTLATGKLSVLAEPGVAPLQPPF